MTFMTRIGALNLKSKVTDDDDDDDGGGGGRLNTSYNA